MLLLFQILQVVLGLCLITSHASTVINKIPAGITPCARNDPEKLNECALQSAQAAIPFISKGNPALGLMPMDPLYVSEFRVNDDAHNTRQIVVDATLRPLVITGLRGTKINHFKINVTSGEMKWGGVIPRLEMNGKYSGSGKIIFMRIRGSGRFNITLENIEFTQSLRLVRAENRRSTRPNSPVFVTPRDIILEYTPNNAIIKLDNLFNGDKRLEDHMNQFLTENWQELNSELGSSLTTIFNKANGQLISRITELIPFDQLFPFENITS